MGDVYTGKLLCRFERSTLPEHEGRRIVALRVLEIVEPVHCLIPDYDGHIERPMEGALVRRRGKVVHINLDHLSDPGENFYPLRMLYVRAMRFGTVLA